MTTHDVVIPVDDPGEHSSLREILNSYDESTDMADASVPAIGGTMQYIFSTLGQKVRDLDLQLASAGSMNQQQLAKLNAEVAQLTQQLASVGQSGQQSLAKVAADVAHLDSQLSAIGQSGQQGLAQLAISVAQLYDQVSSIGQSAQSGVAKVTKELGEAVDQIAALGSTSQQSFGELRVAHEDNDQQISDVGAASQNMVSALCHMLGGALSGDMVLALESGDLEETITAASLNAAAAGTLKKYFNVRLVTATGSPHSWARITPVITPVATCVDEDIEAPTMAGDTKFSSGVQWLEVIFDTDAGGDKDWTAGDKVEVPVKVSSDDKLLGYTVTPLVKIYTVI